MARRISFRSIWPSHCFSSTSSGTSERTYDVVIVGGGMVGLAVAAAIRQSPILSQLRLAIIDRGTFGWEPPELPAMPELRVSTLTPATVDLLRTVGAWQHLTPPRSAAFADMHVWDAPGNSGFVQYRSHEIGRSEMGHVVENSLIASALFREIQGGQRSGVDLIEGVGVRSLHLPPGAGPESATSSRFATLRLEDDREVRARLVVGADGASSRIRELSGIRCFERNYNQRAVVATVATADRPNTAAWQRFLPTGPIAVLPVRGGFSNIVWSTTPEMARELKTASSSEFADAANEALQAKPPKDDRFIRPPVVSEVVGPAPRSFPLMLRHAGMYVLPRLVLVGDAAHAVHPLAGQGVNLGFGDARVLSQALAAAVETGADIGDGTMLENSYGTPRRRANSAMAAVLDGLQRVFAAEQEQFSGLRSFGLGLLNDIPVVKQTIMRYAMFHS